MISATIIISLISLAVCASSLVTSPHRLLPQAKACDDAKVVSNATIGIERTVLLEKYHCPSRKLALGRTDVILDGSPPTDVTLQWCSYKCDHPNPLPPISEDCGAIYEAVDIYYGAIDNTFVVQPYDMVSLSYGTCIIWFSNLSPGSLEYSWKQLSVIASDGETACFPPIQPVQSNAICLPPSLGWEVGVGHS